ncbi:axoneme-associated protein mst101(2)-like [Scylla paramamosain]|uniref:axoneme-associated protein mst101(2)-like n=1 Tax=Scylla paramamosain TaxID=85552 RepID=UPI00308379FC
MASNKDSEMAEKKRTKVGCFSFLRSLLRLFRKKKNTKKATAEEETATMPVPETAAEERCEANVNTEDLATHSHQEPMMPPPGEALDLSEFLEEDFESSEEASCPALRHPLTRLSLAEDKSGHALQQATASPRTWATVVKEARPAGLTWAVGFDMPVPLRYEEVVCPDEEEQSENESAKEDVQNEEKPGRESALEEEWEIVKGKRHCRATASSDCTSSKARRRQREQQVLEAIRMNKDLFWKGCDDEHSCPEPRRKKTKSGKKGKEAEKEAPSPEKQPEPQQVKGKRKHRKRRAEQHRQAQERQCESEQQCRGTRKERKETRRKDREAEKGREAEQQGRCHRHCESEQQCLASTRKERREARRKRCEADAAGACVTGRP